MGSTTNNNTSIHHNYNDFTRKKPLQSLFHQNHTIYHHTIKMGGCGNSNCSCSSCSCAPGSCTCGKYTNPFTNRPSVTSPASTTWLQHHLGVHHCTLRTGKMCEWDLFRRCREASWRLQGWIEGRLDEDTRFKNGRAKDMKYKTVLSLSTLSLRIQRFRS